MYGHAIFAAASADGKHVIELGAASGSRPWNVRVRDKEYPWTERFVAFDLRPDGGQAKRTLTSGPADSAWLSHTQTLAEQAAHLVWAVDNARIVR